MDPSALWQFLPYGYVLTVLIETPVLLVGLSWRHPLAARLFAGLWLTACTYPIVVLVLYPLFETRWLYLLIAEMFAPVAECALFWTAFGSRAELGRRSMLRDMAAIVIANLASFGIGELIFEVSTANCPRIRPEIYLLLS
jgi:hypothetical protein